MARGHEASLLDPFELPGWLGERQVLWTALASVGSNHLVTGRLAPHREPGEGPAEESLDCDVLAADLAYPEPVLSEGLRHDVHQAWALGQVCVIEYDGRMSLAVPGSSVDSELILEALRRLAKAVGASARQFRLSLRL